MAQVPQTVQLHHLLFELGGEGLVLVVGRGGEVCEEGVNAQRDGQQHRLLLFQSSLLRLSGFWEWEICFCYFPGHKFGGFRYSRVNGREFKIQVYIDFNDPI